MDTLKRAQAMMGNQNAAGPHVKRAGAAVKRVIAKVKPPKPSNLSKGLKTTAGWVRDSAAVGAATGAYTSHKLAKGLGMKTAKANLGKVALRGALTGARSAGPIGLAIGTAVTAGSAYKDYKDRQKSVKGRAIAARKKIVAVARKAVKAIKG